MSSSFIERITLYGEHLSSAAPRTLASYEFRRLRQQRRRGTTLVVVYGNEARGLSASPIDTAADLRVIRRSLRLGMTCDYYLVPSSMIIS